MKNVFNLFVSCGLLFGSILLSIVVQEYFHPQKDVDRPPLSEEVFEEELNRIYSGENIKPSFPEVPVMVWWTPFSGDTGIQDCGKHKCYVTNEREFLDHPNLKNIFFYGTSFSEYDLPLPRPSDVDWSLLHEESPKNNQIFSHEDMMVLFNHTSTFRKKSDLSLNTQYLESIEDIISSKYYKPVHVKNRYIKEEGYAPIVYVQSGCEAPSNRDIYVQELMKHIPIDSYGSCLHNKELPSEMVGSEQMDNRDFFNLLSRYKFVLSMENAICPDYVTEKYWRTLSIGSIPIYMGAPNIEDYLPNNKSAILIKDYKTPEEVAKVIRYLNHDDEAYEEYLQHKTHSKIHNTWLKNQVQDRKWGVSTEQQMELGNSVKHFQCLVCNRIADNQKYSTKGFRAAVYKADSSHYGCPVPKNPLTNQVDYNDWYFQDWLRMKTTAKHLRSLVTNNVSISDDDQLRSKIRQEWTQEFMDLVQNKKSL